MASLAGGADGVGPPFVLCAVHDSGAAVEGAVHLAPKSGVIQWIAAILKSQSGAEHESQLLHSDSGFSATAKPPLNKA